MIIKSHIRGGYRAAADYLKDQGKNEKMRLVEISDPDAKNLDQAFHNIWTVASSTRAKKPLHHVSINPMKDERLTDKQVLKIVERLEEKYGYKHGDHQRVIVEHIKDGRQHFHVIWNRVSLTTNRPIWPGHHWLKSKQAAREMEKELGLKRPRPRKSRAGYIRKVRGRKIGGKSSVRAIGRTAFRNPLTVSRNPPALSSRIIGSSIRPMFGFRSLRGSPEPTEPYRPYHPAMPMMKGNISGMSTEQRADYIAACDGKITWRQYFMKWGRLSL